MFALLRKFSPKIPVGHRVLMKDVLIRVGCSSLILPSAYLLPLTTSLPQVPFNGLLVLTASVVGFNAFTIYKNVTKAIPSTSILTRFAYTGTYLGLVCIATVSLIFMAFFILIEYYVDC